MAYSSKNCKYPVSKLREVLVMNTDCHTVSLCRYYSISVSDNSVVFKKTDFQDNCSNFFSKRSVILDNSNGNTLSDIFLKNAFLL